MIRQAITLVPKLWSYLRRSRLHVYFDATSTYQIREIAGGASGYFCHVMVRNDGRTTARNCRGRLLGVSLRNPDGPTSTRETWSEIDHAASTSVSHSPRRQTSCASSRPPVPRGF